MVHYDIFAVPSDLDSRKQVGVLSKILTDQGGRAGVSRSEKRHPPEKKEIKLRTKPHHLYPAWELFRFCGGNRSQSHELYELSSTSPPLALYRWPPWQYVSLAGAPEVRSQNFNYPLVG